MGRLDTNLLHRVCWLGFGLPTYVLLMSKTWVSKVFPKWVESPLWNDGRQCDHPVPVGLWAVEPHIATPDQRVGTKWEELLVVTKDGAQWLNHDAAHCRRARAAGWWKTSERSALAAAA